MYFIIEKCKFIKRTEAVTEASRAALFGFPQKKTLQPSPPAPRKGRSMIWAIRKVGGVGATDQLLAHVSAGICRYLIPFQSTNPPTTWPFLQVSVSSSQINLPIHPGPFLPGHAKDHAIYYAVSWRATLPSHPLPKTHLVGGHAHPEGVVRLWHLAAATGSEARPVRRGTGKEGSHGF